VGFAVDKSTVKGWVCSIVPTYPLFGSNLAVLHAFGSATTKSSQKALFLIQSAGWMNIVSTLLLLGIHSLNILVAYLIAVNTSYISSLVLQTWAYKPLVALYWLFGESEKSSLSPSTQ
jgi:hypothetical protein